MSWRALTDNVMATARAAMGEAVVLTPGTGSPLSLQGIFEVATNFDETVGYADMENFDAMVDFRKADLPIRPRRNDLVVVTRTNRAFRILDVNDDDWGRYRCRLRDE